MKLIYGILLEKLGFQIEQYSVAAFRQREHLCGATKTLYREQTCRKDLSEKSLSPRPESSSKVSGRPRKVVKRGVFSPSFRVRTRFR